MAYSALSLSEVIQLTGLGKEELLALTAIGQFPAALPLGPWTTGWSERDVLTWLKQRQESDAS